MCVCTKHVYICACTALLITKQKVLSYLCKAHTHKDKSICLCNCHFAEGGNQVHTWTELLVDCGKYGYLDWFPGTPYGLVVLKGNQNFFISCWKYILMHANFYTHHLKQIYLRTECKHSKSKIVEP